MRRLQSFKSRVIVAELVVLTLTVLVGVFAFGRDVKITVPIDLRNCAAGLAITAGSDAGYVPIAGDKCVLDPITYNVGPVVNVTLANLTIISRSGAVSTNIAVPINVQVAGVTIDGVTVSAPGFVGIRISTNATRDITVQNCLINNNTNGIFINNTLGAVRGFNFSSNEFRGNGTSGILFINTGSVDDLTINDNTFSGNGEAIVFANGAGVSDTSISGNQILGSTANGIRFSATVTNVKDSDISRNIIEGNGADGILFANANKVDSVTIEGNKSGSKGINGNLNNGIRFLNGGNISDTSILNNVIDNNMTSGILAAPGGDIEDYNLEGNEIKNNNNFGAAHGPGGSFEQASIKQNSVKNNGSVGLLIVAFGGKTDTVAFEGNQASENFFQGILVESATSDVSNISFSGDKVEKNGLSSGTVFNLSGIKLVSFDSISGVSFDNVTALQNGGSGIGLNANGGDVLSFVPANAGDIDGISVTNCHLNMNGGSAPSGQGSGIYATGTVVKNVTMGGSEATSNDDHGLAIASNDDMISISAEGNTFDSNDRNNDGIGAGVVLDSKQDMEKVSIKNNSASGSQQGIYLDIKGANGRDITIEGNTANDNNQEGVLIAASDDVDSVEVKDNTLIGNGVGVSVNVTDRGSGIEIKNNTVHGRSGTGIVLNSTGVTITGCEIRNNDVGIQADKASDNHVNNNNIVGNRQFGIDASGLGPGEVLDAENNWWGQPSGPRAPTNSGGQGDQVTSKVDFDPWLGAPAVVTGADFQITGFDITPTAPAVGATVTITATVTNSGTDEGTQDIIVRIKSGTTVLQEERRTTSLSAAGDTTITLSYAFSAAGSYTVEVVTDNDTKSQTVVVGGGGPGPGPGPGGKTIEGAIAGLIAGDPASAANPDLVIGDQEILKAVEYWITGDEVPGTGGKKIDDKQMLDLIQLWITGTAVSASAAGLAPAGAAGAALRVERIAFTGSRFLVEGSGIKTIAVRVYDLAGKLVFADAAPGNTLAFRGTDSPGGACLANGVYLYAVTVKGADGTVLTSQVRKLVVLR